MAFKSFLDFSLKGSAALEYVISQSVYGSLEQAVASLAVFSHPETVAQLGGRALFRVVRGPTPQRGHIVTYDDGSAVLLDDNTSPTDCFLWCNELRRSAYSDVQFCHIWQCSGHPEAYTNLANLCVLPAFLAKLSDKHPRIVPLLQQRAADLYGWDPPLQPKGRQTYSLGSSVEWAPLLPVNSTVERAVRIAMGTKPKNRSTISARSIGWLFSDFKPDESLVAAS